MHRLKYTRVLEMKKVCLAKNGFTLIELMVTIALIAIMLALATPSMVTFQRNAELTSFTNSMLASLNAARGEAMKRGRYAMVVPADGTNWNSGWVVFVDVDRSQTYDAASDITISTREASPSYLTISGNNTTGEAHPYIMFDASGYSTKKTGSSSLNNSAFSIVRNDVPTAQTNDQTRRIMIAVTGRVRTCKPSTDATCVTSSTQ